MEDNYGKELLGKAKELQKGLEYYVNRTAYLENQLESLDEMYQRRIEEYLKLENRMKILEDQLEIELKRSKE